MAETQADAPQTRRGARPGRRVAAAGRAVAQSEKLPWAAIVLMLCIFLPNYFFAGPFRLSLYKIYLLIGFIPLFFMWLSQKYGGIKLPDILMLLYGIWSIIATIANHGPAYYEAAGIHFAETVGVYLAARVMIRSVAAHEAAMKFYCWTVAFLVPMALFENQTDRRLVSEVVGILLPTYDDVDIPKRWGMERAQGTFEHPILFGVFCAVAVSPAIYVWARKKGVFGKITAAGLMGMGTFTALSTGAYLAYGIQLILVFWDLMTRKIRNRWRILAGGFIFLYVLIDLLSNRSPVQVFISYLTFNTGSSYNRVLIWRYGTQSVENNPLLGIGFNAWERAHWMSTSMDNFWLVVAVRYGLPALICLVWAFLWILTRVGRVDLRGDPRLEAVRKAYMMGVAGLFLSMCTVHLWNATYVYMVFLVGSGVWFLDHRFEDGDVPEDGDDADDGRTGRRRGGRTARPARPARPARARPEGRSRDQGTRRRPT